MNKLIQPFLPRRKPDPSAKISVPPDFDPAGALYAVGDIHGRADLIEPLLQRIDADAARQGHAAPQLVFLGDYIDRGDHAAEVLEHLRELDTTLSGNVTCLMGNHERMMLDFIDDPAGRGARWIANGGLQTLASYGIGQVSPTSAIEDLAEASDALADALPAGTEDWLRALPLWHRCGDVLCVHAAVNPVKSPEQQDERALLWGHRDFNGTRQKDGLWVVHGHTIVDAPVIGPGRISVDTGAYYSNRLTAAALSKGACRFL